MAYLMISLIALGVSIAIIVVTLCILLLGRTENEGPPLDAISMETRNGAPSPIFLSSLGEFLRFQDIAVYAMITILVVFCLVQVNVRSLPARMNSDDDSISDNAQDNVNSVDTCRWDEFADMVTLINARPADEYSTWQTNLLNKIIPVDGDQNKANVFMNLIISYSRSKCRVDSRRGYLKGLNVPEVAVKNPIRLFVEGIPFLDLIVHAISLQNKDDKYCRDIREALLLERLLEAMKVYLSKVNDANDPPTEVDKREVRDTFDAFRQVDHHHLIDRTFRVNDNLDVFLSDTSLRPLLLRFLSKLESDFLIYVCEIGCRMQGPGKSLDLEKKSLAETYPSSYKSLSAAKMVAKKLINQLGIVAHESPIFDPILIGELTGSAIYVAGRKYCFTIDQGLGDVGTG